jgi:hypothetical protein
MSTDTPTDTMSDAASVADCLVIGTVVKSESHMDYTVEILDGNVLDREPEPHEYGFGQPVFVHTTVDDTDHVMMGAIYDTQLVDPDQGRAGPRLARDDQRQFTPGYVEEQTTFAGVALLGTAEVAADDSIRSPEHGMPPWTLSVDDTVLRCPDAVTVDFHTDENGGLRMAYWDRLLDVAGDFGAEVTLAMIERLRDAFGDDGSNQQVLDVIERNVRWQASTDRGVVRR